MKMLLIICPQAREGDIRALIERHNVHAFTQIPEVLGEGEKGPVLGTRAWPGHQSLLFTVVPADRLPALVADLRECVKRLYPDEGVRALVLPVEQVI